jgi:aryl-alcohol dehydrogenase-like predicted oxidoreductase
LISFFIGAPVLGDDRSVSYADVTATGTSDRKRLGIGLAAVGRPAYITAGRDSDLGAERDIVTFRDRAFAVLDAAYAAGIRYVGDWRMDAEVHEIKDHSLEAFTAQWAQTSELLGGRVGIYHVHSATLDSGVLDDAAVHRALAGLRDRGVRVGISTSGPHQADAVRKALTVTVDGAPLFTSFQSTWNVLEPSAAPALAKAADAGAYVIVKESVANGRLAPGGADSPATERVAELAAELGTTVDRLAIAAALAQPWAWRVLSGAVDPAQVASNAAAADLALPDAVAAELAGLAEDPATYWAARSARPWT